MPLLPFSTQLLHIIIAHPEAPPPPGPMGTLVLGQRVPARLESDTSMSGSQVASVNSAAGGSFRQGCAGVIRGGRCGCCCAVPWIAASQTGWMLADSPHHNCTPPPLQCATPRQLPPTYRPPKRTWALRGVIAEDAAHALRGLPTEHHRPHQAIKGVGRVSGGAEGDEALLGQPHVRVAPVVEIPGSAGSVCECAKVAAALHVPTCVCAGWAERASGRRVQRWCCRMQQLHDLNYLCSPSSAAAGVAVVSCKGSEMGAAQVKTCRQGQWQRWWRWRCCKLSSVGGGPTPQNPKTAAAA